MSRSGKVLRTFDFLRGFRAAEKSKGVAKKNEEKVEVCTLSRVLWFSVSRNVLICQKNKKFKCWQLLPGA